VARPSAATRNGVPRELDGSDARSARVLTDCSSKRPRHLSSADLVGEHDEGTRAAMRTILVRAPE